MPKEPEYLDTTQASRYCNLPERTLMFWREKRCGPRCYRLGNRVRYLITDLDSFISDHAVDPIPGAAIVSKENH